MNAPTGFRLDGVVSLGVADVSDPDAVVVRGMARSESAALHGDLEDVMTFNWRRDPATGLWGFDGRLYRHNAFVTNGLNAVLERMGGIGTTAAITNLHMASSTAAVTLATTQIAPTGSRATKTTTNTVNAATSVLSCAAANFTQADINFVVAKMGVGNTSTDPGTTTAGAIAGIWDIIGGSGVAPFNQAFTLDFTGSTSFTITAPTVTVTASNT